MSLKVHYDPELDLLYLARQGTEEECVEIHPGVNLELNKDREIIGIEILDASKILKGIIEPLREKAGSET
ncbi:MAG: DUF2283 domain-containing protein [bacterium]